MKKITQFADKLVDLIRKVEIKTDNNIEAQFFSAMIDLLLLVEQKEREKLKEYEDFRGTGIAFETSVQNWQHDLRSWRKIYNGIQS